MLPQPPWASVTIATLIFASSSGSLGAEWSLARIPICWRLQTKPSGFPFSMPTRNFSTRFDRSATWPQRNAKQRPVPCALRSKGKWTPLPHGKATVRTVAKNLALSVRTQSRRLADEGTTYAEVVDHLRRSLALQYLKEPGISVSQIAWLLGYEGSTSFNHAFRRWTGQSPSTARNQKLLTAALI